jgi:hypothetical protein
MHILGQPIAQKRGSWGKNGIESQDKKHSTGDIGIGAERETTVKSEVPQDT